MPSVGFSNRNLLVVFCLLAMSCMQPIMAWAEDPSIANLDALVAQKQLDQAIEMARRLDGQSANTGDLTLPLARLARELEKVGKVESAVEFYQRSVVAAERDAAKNLPTETRMLVRVAAASVLARSKKLPEAITALKPVLAIENGVSEKHRARAVSICLQIGASALSTGAPSTAAEAYSLAMGNANESQRATAMLGDAWATAIQNDRPMEAAKKLATFIDQYPDHGDTSRAVRACAECLKQADRTEDANAMLADLLKRWPDSDAAMEVVRSHQDLAIDLVPPAVRQWLISKANANQVQNFDAKIAMFGMLVATQMNELAAWSALAKHLAAIDESGQSTADVLNSLSQQGQDAEAERLASNLIAGADGYVISPSAREAACRWAGRTMRWSMLAMASTEANPTQPTPNRTVAVDRLFAEALMQTGQVADAKRWWDTLVDSRDVKDFATLLRCAEAETSAGEDSTLAQKRIDAAREAAEEDRFKVALVNLLDAELSIRRTNFDQARSLLESVVRSSETDTSLRGRAQWLIGETHYLQQKYSEAIEAYRLVEGIDGKGMWVSASLLQAGKAFEQLGRTREATVCYGNLLSRFGETSHAKLARQRMAAIDTKTNDSPSTQTIRR